LGTDFVPYFTRVCYLWTDHADSKQQSVFVGLGSTGGQSTYLNRKDACLNTKQAIASIYEWKANWVEQVCREVMPPFGGLVRPDWVARGGGVVLGKIRGNPDFGLAKDQTLDLIGVQFSRDSTERAIFWRWFLENGTGMLFAEGNYLNPLSHNLQLIDYTVFQQNAALTESDFSFPSCSPSSELLLFGSPGAVATAQREFF
jgi:hypothetical protein